MKKIIFFSLIFTSVLSCAQSFDKSYETITNDTLYTEYYTAFIESSNQAIRFDNIKIDNELKACGLYNDGNVCDALPDCDLSTETVQSLKTHCRVFMTSSAVKEKYSLTSKEFISVLKKYIDENYEVH